MLSWHYWFIELCSDNDQMMLCCPSVIHVEDSEGKCCLRIASVWGSIMWWACRKSFPVKIVIPVVQVRDRRLQFYSPVTPLKWVRNAVIYLFFCEWILVCFLRVEIWLGKYLHIHSFDYDLFISCYWKNKELCWLMEKDRW